MIFLLRINAIHTAKLLKLVHRLKNLTKRLILVVNVRFCRRGDLEVSIKTEELKMAAQKIRIKLSAYDHNMVDQATARIVETMKKAGAKISGPIPLPTEKEVVTILRSPHKYKDSREQFELRTHKRLIDIYSTNAKILDSIHLPAGVDVKIKL